MTEPTSADPDINELEALTELLHSDGWTVFCAHVAREHGAAAQVQAIDQALAQVPRGDREAAEDTVVQIRARAKAAERLVAWPGERVKALKEKARPAGVLAGLRRAGR